jgi:REP element-mobilizing transposase RayT
MPRKPREEVAGGVFHVYARGDDRRPIFIDQADHDLYMSLLARVVRLTGWRCLGYCLMRNHLHLHLETPQPNLGAGMQRLQSEFAFRWNQRYDRCGHVFQGRYGAERAKSEAQFWQSVRYVALNPVRAQLCERPEDWLWSSHRLIVEGRTPAWFDDARLMELLSSAGGDPLERYVELTRVR